MNAHPIDNRLVRDIEQFLFKEARFQDEHNYDAWEALWTEDAIYWIPANGANSDPEREMSIVYDNRSRIALRTRQFHTGKRFTQEPVSNICHIISNVEVIGCDDKGDMRVKSNAIIYESNLRGDTVWACRNEYRLRQIDDELRMAYKKVVLVNNDKPLYTLSFLV